MDFPSCDAQGIGGVRCRLAPGHRGLHAGELLWGEDTPPGDDYPTAKLPPIRDTVRRRPPAPEVRELAGRAELLELMGRELRRDLAELLGEDDDEAEWCGATHDDANGVTWVCGRAPGHEGAHEVHGRRW